MSFIEISCIIFPSFIIPTVSANNSISERIWLEIITVIPCSLLSSCINLLISIIPSGSKPFIGSSNIKISGRVSIARAIANRCFIPIEYCDTCFPSMFFNETKPKTLSISSKLGYPIYSQCSSKFSLPVNCS